jgi:deoxyribose-phosphate aldolase
MVDYSYEIINQIKEATDDSHVKIIIENSFQKQNFKDVRRLMMNIVMALQYVKAEGLEPKALQNVNIAIEIIEQLRKREYGSLF